MQTIAIVGLACRYPDARTPMQLWENVLAQRAAFRRIPEVRLRPEDYPGPEDAIRCDMAAVLEDYEFDRAKYRISAASHRAVDASHWLALDVAGEALDHLAAKALARTTAVYVGNTLTGDASRSNIMRLRWPYVERVLRTTLGELECKGELEKVLARIEQVYKAPFPATGEESLAGGLSNTIAGRICNYFDLKGGGYTIDGACASSLLAVANGCSALAAGTIDMAVAGGVDLSLDPFELAGFSALGALAREKMRVYDHYPTGFWPGEGCGFAVLMREEDAMARGIPVLARVRGWGISSDGHGGITRPEVGGQLLALERAYAGVDGGIAAAGYFEGHGTGTMVGDATELQTLSRARRESGSKTPAAIGSVKALIGHTKAAAGIAGLIKATFAVSSQIIPPTSGCRDPHPELQGDQPALRVVERAELWPAASPLLAGVSAMGFGGINAHVAIEGVANTRRSRISVTEEALSRTPQDCETFLFAATSADALVRELRGLFTSGLSYSELADCAGELARRLDSANDWRAGIVASSPKELTERIGKLARAIETSPHVEQVTDGMYFANRPVPARIGLLFSGQASPVYRNGGAWAARFADARQWYAGLRIPAGADTDTDVAQYAIAASSVAAASLLARLGIEATVALGHSLGELSALHWAGAYTKEKLLELASARGSAMAACGRKVPGAMLSLGMGRTDAEALIATTGLVVASENSDAQTVVSGLQAEIDSLHERCRKRGIAAVRLPVSCAFHSPLMRDAAVEFKAAATGLGSPSRPVISSVSGQGLVPGTDLAPWFERQILEPVRFAPALRHAANDVDLFLEAGPGRVLTGIARLMGYRAIALDAGGRSLAGLCNAVAASFAFGHGIRWSAWFGDRALRPFDPSRSHTYIANPCESIAAMASKEVAPTVAVEAALSPVAPASCKEMLKSLIARRTELPQESLRDEHRFLSDLHLNSITVTQIVAQLAGQLGIPAPVLPINFANVTLAEAGEALEEMVREGGDAAAAQNVDGVASWVRPFEVRWVARPLSNRARPASPGLWEAIAPAGCECGELRRRLEERCGSGTLVYLPTGRGEETLGLLVDAARARGRLLVVQEEPGAESFFRSLYLEHGFDEVTLVQGPLEAVIAEASAGHSGFTECRYDAAGIRFERRMVASHEGVAASFPMEPGDVLLVTGGGKGIGAECGLDLARKHGLKLAILGRSNPLEDRELAANLSRIEAAGVACSYHRADVTDENAVRDALRGVEARGVLHAAGNNIPKLSGELTVETLRSTIGPKVQGLRHVLTACGSPALVIAFGSVIAQSGLEGEAHYALANSWMAAELEEWSSLHPEAKALQLDWSVWAGTGMGERLGTLDALVRRGISPVSVDAGVECLRGLVLSSEAGFTSRIVSGRLGKLPTLRMDEPEFPLLRFLENPLVHVPGVELVCESTLRDASDPYFADHEFEGERLLPAVIGLEAMAQVASALLAGERPVAIKGLELNRPVILPKESSRTIRIAALAVGEGRVDVTVRSDDTGFQVEHFRASYVFGSALHLAPCPFSDAPAIGLDLYNSILFHGPRFRKVEGYRMLHAKHCDSVLGPASSGSWFGPGTPAELILGDPGVRDAALHCIQACIPQSTLLPVRVERILLSTAFGNAAEASASEMARNGEEFVYDLNVHDGRGNTVERWEGLTMRTFTNAKEAAAGWPAALFVPYLERVLEESAGTPISVAIRSAAEEARGHRRDKVAESLLGAGAAITHRPDGMPEAQSGHSISFSHLEPLTIGVQAAHRRVSCDLVEVHSKDPDVWREILGAPMFALAECTSKTTNQPIEHCAALVWAAFECLRKSGSNPGQSLTFNPARSNGWFCFDAGSKRILSAVRRVAGVSAPVAMGVLFETAAAKGASQHA